MVQKFRIFISSPSDVFAERERVERVIIRLNGEFGGNLLEAIRWERAYYTAAKTFQDQIPLPSQTDLVVCVLWKRLGFELPPDYRRPDGTTPTGTEYEFEDAIQAARAKGTPDVLVYRKAAPVLLNAEQVEVERAQFEALKTFWARWFRTETGHFTAAYQSFETTDEFEHQVEDHIRQWLTRHKVASSGITWPIEQLGSPFRGLQPFDAAHATVFFGRRRLIERARERLADAAARSMPFLLILGTSGSGKSSLARAGLMPRLCQPGAVPHVDIWRQCSLRPSEGDTPLHALARALFAAEAVPELTASDSPTPPNLAALLASAPDAAARAVQRALLRGTASVAAREGFDRPVEARLLLLVDQFEEALAPGVREDFARALTALVATGVVWIIATLRSDLYAPFQASPLLMALRDGGAQLDVVPPAAAERAEIITGPAAASGLRFESRPDGVGLDEELIAAATQPGALPLLQLALDALFEARDPETNTLTCAAFDALGGLPGVVERRAEAALAALHEEAAASLPDVLRALVDVTADGVVTSRTAPTAQVAMTGAARQLVEAFVAARLLVADGQGEETSLRVAHDALLASWPRAAALIAADREMLRTRSRVNAAAQRWLQEGRDPDFLLPPGRPLAEATDLAAERPESLGSDVAAFVTASHAGDAARRADAAAHAQRELRLEAEAQQARADAATRVVRRTRLAIAVVSILLVIAAGTAVFAEAQRQEARRQTAEAERNFQAALDGGATLVDAVNAHLRDGGMSRQVAGLLLGTAGSTLGGLAQRDAKGLLPLPLQDTQGRLQASFANVQLALCDSKGGFARAASAVALAEGALAQAPSDTRQRALAMALDTLAQADQANGDLPAAMVAYHRAETLAATAREPWVDGLGADLLGSIRRNMAGALLIDGKWDAALTLLQDDLTRQEHTAAGDEPSRIAAQAVDLRRIAIAQSGLGHGAAADEALDREDALLHRLMGLQPANLEWPRALSINVQQKSRQAQRKGDKVNSAALARVAADLATTIAAHDPGNAQWQRDLVYANIRVGETLAQAGDLAGTVKVLRPALVAARSLTGPESSSLLCQGDAAQLHATAGRALLLTGDNAGAAAELGASLAAYAAISAPAPNDNARLHDVVGAHSTFATALLLIDKGQESATEYQAGIDTLQILLARDGGNLAWQNELADLRVGLSDAMRKAGDLAAAKVALTQAQADAERMIAMQPDDMRWQRNRLTALMRQSEVAILAKQPEAQWTVLQQVLPLAERLVAQQPRNVDLRRDLIQARQAIAAAEEGRSDPKSALAHYIAAMDMATELLAEMPNDPRAKMNQAIATMYVGIGYRFNQQPEEAQSYMTKGQEALAAARAPTH